MPTQVYKKLILIFGLVSIILIAGCDGFGFDRRDRCSAGDDCRYYQGTRGITTELDNPPRNLYHYAEDVNSPDGNVVEINVRLRNEGASDSIGAVFLSGISTDMFEVSYMDEYGEFNIINPGAIPTESCFFNLRSVNEIDLSSSTDFLFSLPFTAQCDGVSIGGGRGRLSLDFSGNFVQNILNRIGWDDAPSISVGGTLTRDGDGTIRFTRGSLGIGGLLHGKVLVTLVSRLDFEAWYGNSFSLRGDNPPNPGGDRDFQTFQVRMNTEWPHGQDSFRQQYLVNTCYAYTTFVSPMICVDRDPFSDELKVCRADRYEWSGSQGGPVAVTSLRQETTRREVVMHLEIENRGRGTVWDVGHLERCSPYYPDRVRPTMKNRVYVGQAYVGNTPLDCSGKEIRLDPNTERAQFICRYPLGEAAAQGSAFEVPLRMELWYGYEENIRNSFTVRRR